ncbi:MAG TPA: epimerase, partial [Thermoanaerobaculia bacterium]
SDMPVWVPGSGDSGGFGRRSNKLAIAAGLTFRPLADTARATLDYHATRPAEAKAKLKAGLSPEREAEVLAAWKKR